MAQLDKKKSKNNCIPKSIFVMSTKFAWSLLVNSHHRTLFRSLQAYISFCKEENPKSGENQVITTI